MLAKATFLVIQYYSNNHCSICLICPQYDKLLGTGACKRVYKGYDCTAGLEIAWNQVRNYEAKGNA